MAVHILYGDSYMVSQAFRRLVSETGGDSLFDANQHQLQGNQVKLPDLLAVANALPFLDTQRLIVVQGLLGTLEGRPGRRRNSRQDSGAGVWDCLAQAVPDMPGTTLLIFVEGPLGENNALLRALRPVSQVERFEAPTGEALARWIKNEAQLRGAGISPAAVRSLADLVGNDLWTLHQELEKLSLYASGGSIAEEDVRGMVAQVREANIFNAVDAMIDRKPGVALRLLQQLRHDGREAPYIIGMVERQLRLVALAHDLREQGISQQDMGARMGVNSQFVVRKTLEQARRHSRQEIIWQYQRLLETDLAIKRGRLEPDVALELLVADLAGAG